MAYELTGALLSHTPPSEAVVAHCRALGVTDLAEALRRHVEDFKRFMLGVWTVGGATKRFETPFAASLPMSIPGTALALGGRGTAMVRGTASGALDFSGAEVHHAPAISLGAGRELHLKPEVFALPGMREIGSALLELPVGYQTEQVGLVESTLEVLSRHRPDTFRQFSALMRAIAVKPVDLGEFTNVSHSDLPGSFVCSRLGDPFWFSDTFVHELYHNRLFFIEEDRPFFSDPARALAEERYYSPWRDEPRPLHGLFHALYVYLPLWRFWLAVLESGEASTAHTALARDQVHRIALQLAIGLGELRRHAELSEFGAEILCALEADVIEARAGAERRGDPAEVPAYRCSEEGVISPVTDEGGRPLSVRQTVLDHLEEYAPDGQAAALRALIAAA